MKARKGGKKERKEEARGRQRGKIELCGGRKKGGRIRSGIKMWGRDSNDHKGKERKGEEVGEK